MEQEKAQREFEEKRLEMERRDKEKTEKNRLKRLKAKERKERAAKEKKAGGHGAAEKGGEKNNEGGEVKKLAPKIGVSRKDGPEENVDVVNGDGEVKATEEVGIIIHDDD